MLERSLNREENALHIDVENLVKERFGCIAKRRKLRYARIGKEDVDRAKFVDRLLIEIVEISRFGHITTHRVGLIAQLRFGPYPRSPGRDRRSQPLHPLL